MLLQNSHPNCWSDHRPVQRRCSSVVRRTANVAPELVQLERSCLADLSTEELEQQLKLHGVHGIPVQTRLPEVKQLQSSTVHTGTHGRNALQGGGLHKQRLHQQNRQPQPQPQPRLQPQQESTQLVQQQNKPEQEAQQHTPRQHHQQLQPGPRAQQQQIKARARRVAASAARRALLLEQLANARVQARSRIVRLPLRLSIAGRAKSRRYLTLPVDVEGAGFIDFLMDSSAYLSRITPGMRDKLGIGPVDGVAILTGGSTSSTSSRGSANSSSSGSRARVRLRQKVQLPKMWLGTAQLPPQQAYVTPLQLPPRQQQFRAAGSTVQRMAAIGAVGGVLGVQVLREFEIDLDFGGNLIALHPPGHVDLGLCDTRGMVAIPLRLTKTGALVIPVSLAGSPPFTGLLDLSAANSMLNWEAAALLGMMCQLDEDDDEQYGGSSSSGSSSDGGGGSRASQPAAQQQRQQQPAIKHVGKFGSLEVVPSDEMLLKPRMPAASPPQHSGRGGSSSPGRSGKQHPPLVPPKPAQQPSSSSSSGGTYSYRPLSSSSIVQQAQVAACDVRLVLGHARLAAAASGSNTNAAAVEGTSSSSNSSITASLALPSPNRFGVAGLKAVGQLGLSGQPVMVVGWDVWARQRVVLCLTAGKVYLSAAPS